MARIAYAKGGNVTPWAVLEPTFAQVLCGNPTWAVRFSGKYEVFGTFLCAPLELRACVYIFYSYPGIAAEWPMRLVLKYWATREGGGCGLLL